MPKYQITAPDGATYEVTGSGTEQEALAHFRAQWEAQQPKEAAPAAPSPINVGTSRADAAKYSLSGKGGEAGGLEQLAGGIKHAWDRGAMGLKGLFTDLTDEDKQLLEQGRGFVKETGPLSTVGEIGGEALLTGGPAVRALQGANALARVLPRALGTATRVAAPSATGAALGALTAPEDRATGAAGGALGGAAGQAIGRVAGGLVKPMVNPQARALMGEGVQPTVGQSVRGSGAVGNFIANAEERLSSVPLVGDTVEAARHRALTEANKRMADRVGGEVGIPSAAVGEAGDVALTNLRKGIGDVYENTLANVQALPIDVRGIQRVVKDVANDPALGLSDDSIKRLEKYVEANLLSRGTPAGVDRQGNVIHEITGEVAKKIESDLNKVAGRFSTSAVGEERAYGEALQKVHEAWRSMLELGMPSGDEIGALRAANRAWAGFSPLDKAAGYVGSQNAGGVATPAALKRAVAALDKTQNDNRTRAARSMLPNAARNSREYVESMTNAAQTLGNRVPDSGTAGRALLPLALGGITQMSGGGLAATAGAALAMPVAYSRIGQAFLTQGIAPRTVERVMQRLAARGVSPEAIEANFENLARVMAQETQGAADATQ